MTNAADLLRDAYNVALNTGECTLDLGGTLAAKEFGDGRIVLCNALT